MESALDTDAIYQRLDSHGLYGRIAALPDQAAEAWRAAYAFEVPERYRAAERIVVLGMGGSGIGGGVLQAFAQKSGTVPVVPVRGYTSPTFADARTLVLASSNSGNTEEIVASLQQAADAGAMCVALTTGGRLAGVAAACDVPVLRYTWDAEPRSALGWSTVTLLAICGRLGLIADLAGDIDAAVAAMRATVAECGRETPERHNPAKQLARRLKGIAPVFIGAEALAPIAYRWRTQVNENAKSWAFADELPEMNHNAPLGYGDPQALLPLLHVVILRHAAMHPRVRLRVDATLEQMHAAGLMAEAVDIDGPSLLAQVLRAAQLGDLVSYYMGLLHDVEPSPVAALDWVKRYMARRPTP
ncbi:MAG: bifunctional phosphoglucose/phosphomannose isomerase [Chloroflexi bacterium]|nr:bifunctional phosphoglucose/phosphomannose isomerase [Chloroflexota bacterium]